MHTEYKSIEEIELKHQIVVDTVVGDVSGCLQSFVPFYLLKLS